MNPTLSDEFISIDSIYSAGTFSLLEQSGKGSNTCILCLPSRPRLSARLDFPSTYPEEPPTNVTPHSSGDARKGDAQELVELIRDALERVFRVGEPCVFDLIEEVEGVLSEEGHKEQHDDVDEDSPTSVKYEHEDGVPVARKDLHVSRSEDLQEPPWVIGSALTEKKSMFLARAARTTTPAQAKSYVAHLVSTDKRASKATHNISAYRCHDPSNSNLQYQDCDDDGESAAGSRLLHLMGTMGVWDVVVVVSRWYGGVKLGPDRFRLINAAAREVLVGGGG